MNENVERIKKLMIRKNKSKENNEEVEETNDTKLMIKQYQVGSAGTSNVNLVDGTFYHEYNLCTIKENAFERSINQVFDMKLFNETSLENHNKFMGRGWKTNFHQRLIKATTYNEETNSLDTTYIDGQGNAHVFKERWYYKENDTKHYVNPSQVYVDSDQKFKGLLENNELVEVKYERINPDKRMLFKGSNLSFKDVAKQKNKKYFIQLKNKKLELEQDEEGYLLVPHFRFSTPLDMTDQEKKRVKVNRFTDAFHYNLIDFTEGDGLSSDEVGIYGEKIYQKNVFLDYKNVILNEDGTFTNSYNQPLLEKKIIKQKRYEKDGKYFTKYLPVHFVWSEGFTNLHDEEDYKELELIVEENIEYQNYNEGSVIYENDEIKQIEQGIKSYEETILSLKETLKNQYASLRSVENQQASHLLSKSEYYKNGQNHLSDGRYAYQKINDETSKRLDDSISLLYQSILHNEETLKKYEIELENIRKRKESLIEEQRKQINDFIIDEEDNILGFDGYGRLIYIQDKYENSITIELDENTTEDKITSISSSNQKVTFLYKDDLLEKIITPKGKIIQYRYEEDNNNEVRMDGQILRFHYLSALKKIDIYDCLQNRFIIEFEDYVKNIIFQQSNKVVQANGSLIEEEESKTLFHHRYQFEEQHTFIHHLPISDDNTHTYVEKYYFDENHHLITYQDIEGNVLFNYFSNGDLVEYKGIMEAKYPHVVETLSTFNQEVEFSVGSDENDDIDRTLLEKAKGIGVLIERTNPQKMTINVEVTTENETTSKMDSYQFENQSLPWIMIPLKIPFDDMNRITITVSTNSPSTENFKIKIVRLSATFYTYDTQKRLILIEEGKNRIQYDEFDKDKPTHITKTDEFGRRKNSIVRYDSKGNVLLTINDLGICNRYFYDEKNQLIEKMTYPYHEPTLVNIEKYQYDEKGNSIWKEERLPGTSLIRKNQSFTYGYDYDTDYLKEIACFANGVMNKTQYTYHYDFLTKLSHDGMVYDLTYDSLGRILSIKIENTEEVLYTFTYHDHVNYEREEKTYEDAYEIIVMDASGRLIKTTYDKKGKILELDNSVVVLNYDYNKENQMIAIKDKNLEALKVFTYNQEGQMILRQEDRAMMMYEYDSFKRLSREVITLENNLSTTLLYGYENSFRDMLKRILIDNKVKMTRDYNPLQQVTKEIVNMTNRDASLLTNEYDYLQQDGKITPFITKQIIKINDAFDDVIHCTYDEKGNILSMTSKQNHVYYQYDELNRIVREDNLMLDTTTLIEYDARGNILSKKEKYFNIGDSDLYKAELKQRYTYATKGWKDQLVSYNENPISYDHCGRPLSYKGKAMIWNEDGTLNQWDGNQYFYNQFGIRTGKQTNLGTYQMVVEDSKILMMKINTGDTFLFRYFVDKLFGFNYNGNEYIYKKDILGNITHILDCNGQVVAEYLYDAWGNHKVYDGNGRIDSNMNSIGNKNPFRYKSYFYDVETQLFYCNSRYYSPELCRWISPDSIEYLDPESINGLNLYAYCGNNPVMYADPSGHVWYNPLTWDWGEIAKGVGLVITGVAAIAVGVVTLPYGGWIAAVAGVTILAGGGTALFGLSDIGEGITDYNVIQEAVFMGNEDAYNLAENIFQYTAIAGTAICGIYGATHTTLSAARSTPRTGNAHSAIYNKQFNTLTYYGKNGQMKYSMHLFNRGHQWVHWHTELPHSQPINNFLRFVWEMAKRGF